MMKRLTWILLPTLLSGCVINLANSSIGSGNASNNKVAADTKVTTNANTQVNNSTKVENTAQVNTNVAVQGPVRVEPTLPPVAAVTPPPPAQPSDRDIEDAARAIKDTVQELSTSLAINASSYLAANGMGSTVVTGGGNVISAGGGNYTLLATNDSGEAEFSSSVVDVERNPIAKGRYTFTRVLGADGAVNFEITSLTAEANGHKLRFEGGTFRYAPNGTGATPALGNLVLKPGDIVSSNGIAPFRTSGLVCKLPYPSDSSGEVSGTFTMWGGQVGAEYRFVRNGSTLSTIREKNFNSAGGGNVISAGAGN